MLAANSADGTEVVPWVVRLKEPHPPQVLRVAGALTDITASRMRALMTGYRLLDVGLLAPDRPVELPDLAELIVNRAQCCAKGWDCVIWQELAELRRLAAESPSGGGG